MVQYDKKRIIKYVIGTFFATLVLFVFIFLIKLADWYIDWFSTSGFSIVVYQLSSPIQGTAGEILDGFKNEALYRSILITLLIIFFLVFLDALFTDNEVSIMIRLGSKYKQIELSGRNYKVIRRVIRIVLSLILVAVMVHRVYAVGIPRYLQEISDSSTIYEEEYIAPDTVDIRFPENKRNLLILYIESMEASYMDREHGGNADVNYIPELTALAEENVNISPTGNVGGFHIYGIGNTMAGLLASTSGINYKIPVKNETAVYFQKVLPGITSLGDILEKEGYRNYFLCGSEGEFGGREQYYTQHGGYEILDLEYADACGYIPSGYHNEAWGYEDIYLYEIAKSELTRIAAEGQPFNFNMLTVDTHGPNGFVCDKCPDEFDDQYANVLACASAQAYDFIGWVQEQDWYENTTVLIMGDHTSMVAKFMNYDNGYEKQVYDCIINPSEGLDLTRVKNREFSTLDIFPTILAGIGAEIQGDRLGLGVNIFSDEPTLPERIGKDEFYNELQRNSNYYRENFIN